MVFYESVHRIDECLDDMAAVFGPDRPAFIGRELTKLHEQAVRGSLQALREMLGDGSIPSKGEFVIVVGGANETAAGHVDVDRLLRELASCLSASDAAKIAANVTGLKRNTLYDRIVAIRNGPR